MPVSIAARSPREGRLSARPSDATAAEPTSRLTTIDVHGDRDALLFVPTGVDPAKPTPLVLMLHGAGGSARAALDLIDQAASRHGVAVLAFSPGFLAPARTHGRPRVLITHGTEDRVLPIDRCGRRLARVLESAGYEVRYDEVDGVGHTLSIDVVDGALERLVGRGPARRDG